MERDPALELFGALTSLLRAARAAAHRNSHLMGASGTPLGVLKTLRAGDARPSDLAVALQIGPSVVSRALVPLEQEGLVERTTDPADARATLIRLTDRGRGRLDALQQIYLDQIRTVLASWSDLEVAQAADVLNRLVAAISQPYAAAAHRHSIASALLPPDLDAVAEANPLTASPAAILTIT